MTGKAGGAHFDFGWFRTHLVEELLPIWIDKAPTGSGLFLPHFDRRWRPGAETYGTLVSQSRLLYNFSVGWELTGEERYRKAVEDGARFLIDKFRDREKGGWFWAVDGEGRVADDMKDSYGHAFTIFGLGHAARCLNDPSLAGTAREVWSVIQERFADGRGGIYRHMDREFAPRDEPRSQNPIMHLFEALLALGDAPGQEAAHRDAQALGGFVLGRLLRKADGILPEVYDEEWRELSTENGGRIDVGHQFEWAFLLSSAVERGLPAEWLEIAEKLLDNGLRLGYDPDEGGIFSPATSEGQVTAGRKSWWPQCELVRTLMHFAVLRRRGDLWEPLAQTVRLLRERFLDPAYGGWYPEAGPGLDPEQLHKGSPFKVDYHNVGMCAEAIRLAAMIEDRSRPSSA